jgi:YidC/Oxa1 family membrane protein insertase
VPKDEKSSQTLGNALFQGNGSEKIKLAGKEDASLEFEFSDRTLRVWKKITFTAGSYLVQTDCKVWLNGQPADYLLLWRAGFGDRSANPQTAIHESVYRSEGSMNRLRADKVRKKVQSQLDEASKANQPPRNDLEFSGRIEYAGLNDQYFAAMFLPAGSEPIRSFLVSEDVRKKEDGKEEILLKAAVGASGSDMSGFRIFVGPKDTEVLKKAGFNLVELIDYGWFKFFCQPMFLTLKWLYSFSKNYGVAIILLTTLISIALLPLRWKSMHSAQKMQKLQPQMKAIQEKYKKLKATDPKKQQMNQEVMALYKEHGVNPLGGCLPLVIQLPFFYAIYNLLSVAIELRQAPFIWWIKDLSVFDHTYVLPILFTASMIAIQKMTPTPSSDPIQAKMMMAMPLVFGFMLSATPSGLVLYWLTSNLVGVVQQLFMNRYGPGAQEKKKEVKKKGR